jgi:hypothetical protein
MMILQGFIYINKSPISRKRKGFEHFELQING